MKSSLGQKGFNTSVTPLNSNGKTLYRVRVGSYAGRDAAIHFQTQLKTLFKSNSGIQNSIIVKHSPASNDATQQAQCYSKKEGNDLTAIELNEKQGKVSGYYTWAPKERDGAYGSFTGTKTGDQIKARYTYMIEGSIQTEQVAFKLGNNVLIQGQGEMVDKKDGSVFKDPTKLNWTDRFAKVNCNTIKEAINNAKQVTKDIQKKRSAKKPDLETVTSSENIKYNVTYNKMGMS